MRNPILILTEKWRESSLVQRVLLLVLAAGLCLLAVGRANRRASSAFPPMGYQTQYPVGSGAEPAAVTGKNELKELPAGADATRDVARNGLGRMDDLRIASDGPLIAHTAELAVATKEFVRSRMSLEEILVRHRGYAAKLRMVGQSSGSVLSATLRVPSAELGGTVSELKSLGDVEREEQAADEITEQQADLEARLGSAQKTLKRLQELLQKQTYPDGNVRELQRQILNASTEVARLGAEKLAAEHRVIFANLYFTLREEVAKPPESLGAQLRGAAAAGFGEATASLAGLLVFLIGRGPVVVLWGAILWVPVRLIWKKWAPVGAQPSAAAQGD